MQASKGTDVWLRFLLVVLFVLVGIVVFAVVLTRNPIEPNHPTLPTAVPTLAPTDMPWTLLFQDSTQEALLESDSPQSLALEWVLADPNLVHYDDQRILQRFALATFFYSTSGDQWNNQTYWLSYDRSECEWYSNNEFALTEMMQIL
jgi:hypothetical protein